MANMRNSGDDAYLEDVIMDSIRNRVGDVVRPKLKVPTNSVLNNYDNMRIKRDGNSNLQYYDDTYAYSIGAPQSFILDVPTTKVYYPMEMELVNHIQPVVTPMVTPRLTSVVTNRVTPVITSHVSHVVTPSITPVVTNHIQPVLTPVTSVQPVLAPAFYNPNFATTTEFKRVVGGKHPYVVSKTLY